MPEYVINFVEPEHVDATATADAGLVWIGNDDRGVELESWPWTSTRPSS